MQRPTYRQTSQKELIAVAGGQSLWSNASWANWCSTQTVEGGRQRRANLPLAQARKRDAERVSLFAAKAKAKAKAEGKAKAADRPIKRTALTRKRTGDLRSQGRAAPKKPRV